MAVSVSVSTLTDFIPEELTLPGREETVRAVAFDVMAGARAFWIQQAQARLHQSRRDYLDALQEVEEADGGGVQVTLLGAWPVMLEEGAPPFSMHDTLLGPNVPVVGPGGGKGKRMSQDGHYYRAIPFRHQGPETSGQGGGTPMGAQYHVRGSADQLRLGRAVMGAARKLAATRGMPGGPVQYGGRLAAGTGGVGKLKPHHTTDIYAGMVRQEKTYRSATQSTYTTFRMISSKHPEKWLHPGLAGVHIVDDVVAHVERIAPAAFLAAAWGGPDR